MNATQNVLRSALLLLVAAGWGPPARGADAAVPAWTDAATAASEHPGFRFLGEYVRGDEALQVAPAQGRFYVSRFRGGLPGEPGAGPAESHRWVDAEDVEAVLEGFERVDRSAGLTFAPPPAGALVLFDGTGVEHFRPSAKTDGALLEAGATTRREFRDFTLHFEAQMPYKPALPISHPRRGNSGVYLLGVYEIQLMDSFALPLDKTVWKQEEMIKKPVHACGAVYGLRSPDVNASLPPLSWNSFDVTFTAARFEGETKTADARVTVFQNGVLIHNDYAIPLGTGGGPKGPRPEVAQGPLYFQDHGNPNRFRNIWVVERAGLPGAGG